MIKKGISLLLICVLCSTMLCFNSFAEPIEVNGDGVYTFSDDFNSYQANVSAYGQNKTLSQYWRGKTAKEGYMGGTAELYTNESKFGFDGTTLKIYGSSVADAYNYKIKYNSANSQSMPAVIFDAPASAPKEKQIIKFSVKKSHAAHTLAFRFMVHENTDAGTFDSYTLWLPGLYSSANIWSLYKEVGGTVTEVANGGKADTSTSGNDSPTGFIGTKKADVTITYDNGKITFEVSCLSGTDSAYTLSGSYTDANPFAVEKQTKSTAVWLMAGAMYNETKDRYAQYDDFSYTSSGAKPMAAIYQGVGEGEGDFLALPDAVNIAGVIISDLILAEGSEECQVYVSNSETETAEDRLLTTVSTDTTFMDNLMTEEYQYIKLVGGSAKIAAFVTIPDQMLYAPVGRTLQLYAFFDGAHRTTEAVWKITDGINGVAVDENGMLDLKSAVKDVWLQASYTDDAGDMHTAMVKINVRLADASFSFVRDNDNLKIAVASEDCKGKTCKGYVIYYHKNHTMASVTEHNVTFDATGEALITAPYVLPDGGTVRVLMLDGLQSLNPLVKVKEFRAEDIH